MNRLNSLFAPLRQHGAALLALALLLPVARAEDPAPTQFELRVYHAAEGKLEALHTRFREHTMALFEKHGMTNVAYWVPASNEENLLVYLLSYPDRASREASWKAFSADPEWQAAKAASQKNGKLVDRVEKEFLHLTDYSPSGFEVRGNKHLFEMRRYTARPEKLAVLDRRFRDHTLALLAKHGMTNLPYFHLDADQAGADHSLIYFLAHDSAEAQAASFAAFRADPAWIAARDASEKEGKIVVEKGVVSTSLIPTDYSPLQ